jgi:hypothetical protein
MSDQETFTKRISQASLAQQTANSPDLRQLHPKSHGLLHGTFKVREDIPSDYKIGVLATPHTYPIWVRFSNGSSAKTRGVLKPDTKGDVRGMAIKLMDVSGTKILDDETGTQDFILIDHPVFFLPDVQGYIEFGQFQQMKAGGQAINPELFKKLKPSLEILGAMNSKSVGNPLLIQYWSTTPYQLGSHQIKFLVKPHDLEGPPAKIPDSPNYLREVMVNYFKNIAEFAQFDFQIQVYVDDNKTPIENPMIEWKETDSPPITVATITIPKQLFDFEERKRYDESLSFSPWHTLPEHQPLGSINLSRKEVYQEGAKNRRNYIEKRLRQPQPYDSIKDDPQ